MCRGYYISNNNGQDTIACSRCNLIRKLLYERKVVSINKEQTIHIMKILLSEYSFIEHAEVLCGNSFSFVYPLFTGKHGDPDLIEEKLKEHFLFRNRMKIVDKDVKSIQIYSRNNRYPVIMPCETTELRTTFGNDEGVIIQPFEKSDGQKYKVISIVNIDKAFQSGKYMYVINFYQVWKLIFERDVATMELF